MQEQTLWIIFYMMIRIFEATCFFFFCKFLSCLYVIESRYRLIGNCYKKKALGLYPECLLSIDYFSVSSWTSQGLYLQVYADGVTVRGHDFMNRTWIKEAD